MSPWAPEPACPCRAAWRKLQRCRVHAQSVLGGIADKGLRVHRAGEMYMQVRALGKLLQKGVAAPAALWWL
jgi:hypothetical protein